MKEGVVVYSGTRNLYPDMVTAAKSLLYHNKDTVEKVYFLVEDDYVKEFEDLPDSARWVWVNVSRLIDKYFPHQCPNRKSKFTPMALIRACYPEIFPECRKVLSLDVDTIVVGDISELWNLDLHGYYFAAVPEPNSAKNGRWPKSDEYYANTDKYFNVGVALYNLEYMNYYKIPQKAVDMLNTKTFYSVEQDVLNLLCQGEILELDSKFNASELWTAPTDNPKIIHYAGIDHETWSRQSLVRKYREMKWSDIYGE